MTAQLSRERLEEISALEIKTTENGTRYSPRAYGNVKSREIVEMARMLLAGMDSEPVAWRVSAGSDGITPTHLTSEQRYADLCIEWGRVVEPLYAAPPAPVAVPDEMEPTIEAIKRILPTSNPDEYAACIGADMWNTCRAAMLAPGVMYDPVAATTGSAAMQSFGNSEQLKTEPVSPRYTLPAGWKLVPVEPTPEMLSTITEAIKVMRGSAATYSRVLAVAPAAPEQEV